LEEKIKEKFLDCVKDKCSTRDANYEDRFPYENKITIAINEFEFYHHGFSMTKTNMVRFSKFVEYEIKEQSRLFSALFKSFGMTYTKGFRIFQKTYRLSEEDFNLETAMKDNYRNGIVLDDCMEDKICEILATITKKNIVQFVR
jgi:hypothetical protein